MWQKRYYKSCNTALQPCLPVFHRLSTLYTLTGASVGWNLCEECVSPTVPPGFCHTAASDVTAHSATPNNMSVPGILMSADRQPGCPMVMVVVGGVARLCWLACSLQLHWGLTAVACDDGVTQSGPVVWVGK